MKLLFMCLLMCTFFSGCSSHSIMKDIIDNQFEDKKIYADSNATYVGEWVGDQKSDLMPIKITKEGKILMCVMKKNHMNVDGKVYIENGETRFIFEGGTVYKLDSVDKNLMILDYYGEKATYHSGTVPEKCAEAFKKFE